MTLVEAVTRVFPAVFFAGIAAFYTVRIVRLRRRLGRSPVSVGRPGSLAYVIARLFRVFRLLILLAMAGRVVWPGLDPWLVPIPSLWAPPAMLLGDALMLAAILGILACHARMGPAWRSGIEPDDGAGALWTDGPYRLVRHPMFSLILLGQAGLFLAVPSLFTGLCLVVGAPAVLAQARLEEVELAARFGTRWERWAARTPAWPWEARLLPRPRGWSVRQPAGARPGAPAPTGP